MTESVFPGFGSSAEVGAELAKQRYRLGLSQTEVAARMRTSQSAVARLEAGGGDPRVSTLRRYVAALGCDLEWRLTEAAPERGFEGGRP